MESLGVTSQSKREVRAEEREPQCWWRIFDGSPCCMISHSSPPFLDAGIYIKKKRHDDQGGYWRSERQLMESAVTANEIFVKTQVSQWPIHLGDGFQA